MGKGEWRGDGVLSTGNTADERAKGSTPAAPLVCAKAAEMTNQHGFVIHCHQSCAVLQAFGRSYLLAVSEGGGRRLVDQ